MKKFLILATVIVCAGCAMTDDAVKKSIVNINEELVVIQKSVTDNQVQLEEVVAAQDVATADIASNMDAIAELRSELTYLNNELMMMKGKAVKVSTVPNNANSTGITNITPLVKEADANKDNKKVEIVEPKKSSNAQIIIIEDATVAKNSIYSYAVELYRQRKYTEARAKFQEFMTKFPKDPLVGNAQYWIGETYYSKDEMKKALDAFQMVVTTYPKSSKVPDAMLKVGYCYDNIGDKQKATETLKGLLAKYPKSKPSELAQAKLTSWGL